MANNNRKYRRQMHQKVDSMPTSFSLEFGRVIKILLVIVIVLVVFYFLTAFILEHGSRVSTTADNTPAEADIQYQEILAGNSFTQNDNHYFVLYYDMSDENLHSIYTNIVSIYEDNEDHLPIYTVDMSSAFNKKYVADDANPSVEEIGDLQIAQPTLIEFENDSVVDYIEGEEAIRENLS